MGVPVTIADGEVIVGFDRARLDRLATRLSAAARQPARFGVAARDAAGGGAEVGRVNTGQPAERAGVRPGDVIEAINGRPVRFVDDLEREIAAVPTGTGFEVTVRRGSERLRLRAPG